MAGEELHSRGGEALHPAWEREPVAPSWEDAGDEPLVQALREAHGDAVESARRYAGDLTLQIRREALAAVARSLKEEHGFTLLLDLRGTGDPLQTVYSLQSPETSQRVRLKVAAPERVEDEEEVPAQEPPGEAPEDPPPGIPAVSGIWQGAAWLEREVRDRFGARFDGHPELEIDRPTGAEEEMELRFGTRPPAPPGLLRLRLRLDGERIVDGIPLAGPLRRGAEEERLDLRPFPQSLPLADHPDSAAARVAGSLAACGTVERLVGLAVPPRARYLRTVFAELERIASHLLWLAAHTADVGDPAPSPACLGERERILELMGPDAPQVAPGGLLRDLPPEWIERCRAFLEAFPGRVDEVEGRLTENRVWKKRTVGVGILPPEVALDYGVTGPMLRASGVARDLRKDRPYEAYGEVELDVPVGKSGDTYDRYCVRVEEMRQSARVVATCLDRLPDGPVRARCPEALRAAADAEIYHGVEAPRGEVGLHVSGEVGEPGGGYRCHLRTPSPFHLRVLPELARGQRLAALVALIGSCDLALALDD